MTDAQTVTKALGGHWYGSYGVAMCPAHRNTRTPALSLANGHDGRLLAKCHAGCEFSSILDALGGRGLIIRTKPGNWTPPETPAFRPDRESDTKKPLQAKRLWSETEHANGTLVEAYLRSRGIAGPVPETLHFSPRCWHPTGRTYPAMVALVEGGEGFAVHRTYLLPDGSGKAHVQPQKAALGSIKGGHIRLTNGEGQVIVAEGIETALSIPALYDFPFARLWACVSAPGVCNLNLPDTPGQLTIARDPDRAGIEASNKLAERACKLGWKVDFLTPPQGRDWNDVLREGVAA